MCIRFNSRYLAGGRFTEQYSACNYRISPSSSNKIISQVCQAIYEELAATEFMEYNEQNWINVSNEFFDKWNMPNCLGAIDGKHVKIKCPVGGGSLYFNYKVCLFVHVTLRISKIQIGLCYFQRFHSLILLGACDASCKFTFVDIGSPGADGDMNVFARSDFGSSILTDDNSLNLPTEANINGVETPFFFLGDDAFPLTKRLMKPYKPKRGGDGRLTNEEKVFNYRLSRARRTIENAFGILTMRWGCLRTEFLCSPEKVKVIVGACCALHNYLMKRSHVYAPPSQFDRFDDDGVLIEGEWRQFHDQLEPLTVVRGRPISQAVSIRERLKNFFFNINILPHQFSSAHCIFNE